MNDDKKPIYKKWWFWLIAAVLIFIIIPKGNNRTPNNNRPLTGITTSPGNIIAPGTSAPSVTPAATSSSTIKAGMYKVGTDIPEGEYIIFSNSGTLSYYQLTKDSSGSLDSIISNDNFAGTRYITVSKGQYIELKDASMIPVDKAPVLGPTDGKYNEGMYKVGRDIKAGEYKVIPMKAGGAYVEVAKDSKGTVDSIEYNDNFTAEKYVTIKDGQYIKLVGCNLAIK
jgi:hypothetical protein